jgi:hypothetical protein
LEKLGRHYSELDAEWNKLGQAWAKFNLSHP